MERVIPKEWTCVSGAFKGLHYAWYVFSAFGVVFLISVVLRGAAFTSLAGTFMFLLCVTLVVLLFCWLGQERKYKATLQRVVFLPNYMYVNKYRIPYSMIQSIELSDIHIGRRELSGLGFFFKLELKTNTQACKTILFTMDFSGSPFVPQYDYDYQKNFIDVVMQWAREDVEPPSQYTF